MVAHADTSHCQKTIAALAGIAAEKVNVQLMLSGGSFGRRYQWDYLAEAYNVAKNIQAPVQLVWTREDDMQHDFYLQYSFQRMRAVLEEDGRIAAWWYREVTTPIFAAGDQRSYAADFHARFGESSGSAEASLSQMIAAKRRQRTTRSGLHS